MKKRWISTLMALCLLLTLVPTQALAAEARDGEMTQEVYIPGFGQAADNDEWFAGYVNQLFFGSPQKREPVRTDEFVTKPTFASSVALNEATRQVYNAMKVDIADVANGRRASTTFSYQVDGTAVDSLQLLRALMADYPYEMYWYDKMGGLFGSITNVNYTVAVPVVYEYRAANYNAKKPMVDTAKTGAAANAVENAQSIIEEARDNELYPTAFDKLTYLKDAICERVAYHFALQDSDPYGDPWQIIYVFDDDPDTNVVCEGYAKAFQYLCEQVFEDSDQVACYTVTGEMADKRGSGLHMWNVVKLEGKNYLVDVTNCDDGTAGAPDQLFLVGASGTYESSFTDGYIVTTQSQPYAGVLSQTLTYRYSTDDPQMPDMKSFYTEAEITLSDTDYCADYSQQSLGVLYYTVDPTKQMVWLETNSIGGLDEIVEYSYSENGGIPASHWQRNSWFTLKPGSYTFFTRIAPKSGVHKSGSYVVAFPNPVTITEPLVFQDSDSFDIPAGMVGEAITPIDVSSGVSGGTKPYTFNISLGPAWLSVSTDGLLSGTPTVSADATTAVIEVRDVAGGNRSIYINIGEVSQEYLGGAAVVLSAATAVYNGNDQKPTVTSVDWNGPLTENVDYTVSFRNSAGETVSECVDAGVYTAVVTGIGSYSGEATEPFTITAATPTITGNDCSVMVGNHVALSPTTVPGNLPLSYTVTDGQAYASVDDNGVVTGLAVGVATITVSTEGMGANYGPASTTITVTVSAKNDAALEFVGGSAPYVSTGYTLGEQYTASVGQAANAEAGTWSFVYDGNAYDSLSELTASVSQVGSYSVTATYDSEHYYGTASAIFTITKADQAGLTFAPAGMTYGDSQTLSVAGGTTGGEVTYAVTSGTDLATVSGNTLTAVGVGTVTVTATMAGNEQYNPVSREATITISKSTPSIANNSYPTSVVYSGTALTNPRADQLTVNGAIYSDLRFAWSGTPTDVGNYTLTISLPDSENASAASLQIPVTITRKPISVPVATTGLVYNGTPRVGVATGEGYTLTGNTATNAGNYNAVATLDANHMWENESVDAENIAWSIARKSVEIPTGAALTYNGVLQNGVVSGNSYSVTEGAAVNAGSYTATVTLLDPKNNQWVDGTSDAKSVVWSIAPASQAAPQGLGVEAAQSEGGNGKITGTTTAMEYSAAVDGTYTGCSEPSTSVAPNTYYVRYKADANHSASSPVAVEVWDYNVPLYTVTIAAGEGGIASASVAQTRQGETVTLIAIPDNGCVFVEWKVVEGGVTVTDNSFTMGTENVTISPVFAKVGVTLDRSTAEVKVGNTVTLQATATPSGAAVTWTSSDTGVATVSSSGVVTGVAAGQSTITATVAVNGVTASSTCAVTVKATSSGSTGGGSTGGGSGNTSGGSGGGNPSGGSENVANTPAEETVAMRGADGSLTTTTTKTTVKNNWDGSKTETVSVSGVTEGEDGSSTVSESKTATTTAKKADGSTTGTITISATEKRTNADGSTSTTETNATGTSTTTTKKAADNSVEVTTVTKMTETAVTTDTSVSGEKTVSTTKTEIQSTAVTDQEGNGVIEESKVAVVTDRNGSVLSETTTETRTEVSTDAAGNVTAISTVTETLGDKEKNVTVMTEVTTPDGTVGTLVTDEQGNMLLAEITVSEAAAEKAVDHPIRVPLNVVPVPAANRENGPVIALILPEKDSDSQTDSGRQRVEISVPKTGPGIVAYLRDRDGGLTLVKDCAMGSLIVPVDGSCELVIVDNTKTFRDVAAGSWYENAVTFVTAREIFNGTGADLFAPDGEMTRGMVAQMLYNFDRNAKSDGTVAFADTEGKWYNDAASWAAGLSIVAGTGNGFEGDGSVTREQLAVMLYRYAAACGYDVGARASLENFADAETVSAYAADAMRWAVDVGLINGMEGNLNPQGRATRAQVATIMERFCENVVR